MTQQTPAPGDVFIDEYKRSRRPESSWLYYLIREDGTSTLSRDTGWLAIFGPGPALAGVVTHIGTVRLNKMKFVGVVGDRLNIPPLQEES